jgi:transposase InsO family protein
VATDFFVVARVTTNQVWVTDITYVATTMGWIYLVGIKIVFTCEVVG